MNRKHQKTLKAIFGVPTLSSINFADIEKLLVALGAEKIEGSGSRVAFAGAGRRKVGTASPASKQGSQKVSS